MENREYKRESTPNTTPIIYNGKRYEDVLIQRTRIRFSLYHRICNLFCPVAYVEHRAYSDQPLGSIIFQTDFKADFVSWPRLFGARERMRRGVGFQQTPQEN